jgi:hypothetical protein
MRKLLIILTTLVPFTILAQTQSLLTTTSLKAANYKNGYGVKVSKLSGLNSATGSINIYYKSHEQYIREQQNAINKQKWTASELFINTNLSLDTAKGGFIYVYITNEYPNLANTYNITITIKDSTENELYSKRMSDLFPEMPSLGSSIWTNHNYIAIPVQVDIPFFAYVSDINDPKNVFKYKIESHIDKRRSY